MINDNTKESNNEIIEIKEDDITITSSGIFLDVDNKKIFLHRMLLETISKKVTQEAIECMKILLRKD